MQAQCAASNEPVVVQLVDSGNANLTIRQQEFMALAPAFLGNIPVSAQLVSLHTSFPELCHITTQSSVEVRLCCSMPLTVAGSCMRHPVQQWLQVLKSQVGVASTVLSCTAEQIHVLYTI